MLNCNNNVSSWKGLLSKVANYEDTPMMTENDFPAGATGDIALIPPKHNAAVTYSDDGREARGLIEPKHKGTLTPRVHIPTDSEIVSWAKNKIANFPGKSSDIDPDTLDNMIGEHGVSLKGTNRGGDYMSNDELAAYVKNKIANFPGKSSDIDPDTVKAMAAEHGVYLDEPKLKASDFKIKPLAEGSKLGLGHAVAGAAASAGSAGVLMKILKKRKKKATVSKLRKILRAL